jgi:xanthine dehydrogenase YagR molybdenum-binding subunit
MNASPRIGDPVNRFDGEAKVTGSARYAAEHFPQGLLYGWIVSSPLARGRVTAIDEEAARAVPGVVEVISHRNRRHLPWFDRRYKDEEAASGSPFRPLYDDKVVFSGQPVALVVAQTLEAARDAASLVRVSYQSASHNTDFERAMAEQFAPKSLRKVVLAPRSRGDPDQALKQSPVRHTATYRHAAEHHNPMEMHAATVIWEPGNRLTVHDKTQGTQNVQSYLARIFGGRRQGTQRIRRRRLRFRAAAAIPRVPGRARRQHAATAGAGRDDAPADVHARVPAAGGPVGGAGRRHRRQPERDHQ